jgi:hypothetical protein
MEQQMALIGPGRTERRRQPPVERSSCVPKVVSLRMFVMIGATGFALASAMFVYGRQINRAHREWTARKASSKFSLDNTGTDKLGAA